MSGFITQPIGNAALTGGPGENAPTDLYPRSVWDSIDLFGATSQLARGIGTAAAEYGTVDDYGRQVTQPEPTTDAATLNDKYGIKDHLTFTNPLPESVASSMHDAKRGELVRQDAAANLDNWRITQFGANLAAGAVDPLNLAASVLPVVGEARVMGWLARAGLDTLPGATMAARFGAGVIGATTAQIPLVSLRYGLSRQEQADYSMSDAMADIVMGGLLGGGMHTAIGGLRDLIGSTFARSAVSRLVADDPAARERLHRAAVAQLTQGDPVDLARVLDTTALRSAYADRLAARGETGDGSYAAFAPSGHRIELRPEVVEADSLITSHQADGTVNPAYPHDSGMQARDRSSVQSQEQVNAIAARLEPERLGPAPEAAAGAPIVNQAGAVESGNGRVAALRRVYEDPAFADQAAAYRAFLEARGHDLTGMQKPVLIGRRVNDMSPEDVRAFTRSANERGTLGLSAAETARADADRAGRAAAYYAPGPLHGKGNERFVSSFLAQLPIEEQAGMKLKDGTLSLAGEQRIRSALLAYAYGDALGPTLERMLNGDVAHFKSLAGALVDAAGQWARLRQAAAAGEIPASLDITAAIGEAAQLVDRARSTGQSLPEILAQADMIGGPSPAAIGLLRLMFYDEGMRRPVGRERLAALLDAYVEQALQAKPGPNLFGEPETTPAEIMALVAAGAEGGEAAAAGLATAPAELERATPTPGAENLAPGVEGSGEAGTPAPEAGTVRFYHGGVPYDGAEGGSRFLTDDPAYAAGYAAKTPGATVQYVDLPEDSPLLIKAFDDTGTGQKAPYVHFDAPPEIAAKLKPFEPPPETPSEPRTAAEAEPRGEATPAAGEPGAAAAEDQPGLFGDEPTQQARPRAEAQGAPMPAAPRELTEQIDAMTRDLADDAAAARLEPEAAAELEQIQQQAAEAQTALAAIGQAATCLLGGLA